MPEPFSLSICALKTASAMCSILAACDKDVSFESVALAVEGLVKGDEAVKAFRERDQKIFAATLNATAKKLEALYQDSLRQSHSAGFKESVQVAFANLSEVIARCLPTGEALARMNHDPEKIAAAVVDAALKIRMEAFADPHSEARDRSLLAPLSDSSGPSKASAPRAYDKCLSLRSPSPLVGEGRDGGSRQSGE